MLTTDVDPQKHEVQPTLSIVGYPDEVNGERMKLRSDRPRERLKKSGTHAVMDAVRQSPGTAMRTQRSDFDS